MTRLTSRKVIFYFLLSLSSTDFLTYYSLFMLFTKEHLTGLYNWAPEHVSSLFDRLPGWRTFDRYNGNQVFFIINLLLKRAGTSAIDKGSKIEMLIINKLPIASSSELTVFKWLKKEMIRIQ